MTVPNENNEVQVVLTSATQNIPTTYYFLESDNLTVKNTDQAATPVTTTLIEGTNYTVTLPASIGGNGSIDMIGATIGDTVTIIRCLDATQEVSYVENARFPAKVTEKALDRLTMLINKVYNALFGTEQRFLQYPDTELGTNPVTPSLSDRQAAGAGTLAAFKGSDGAIDAVSKGSVGAALTLSNDSTLGQPTPDAVNGVTQSAVLNFVYNSVYPVGSIYCNKSNSANPNTILGFGTWVAVTDAVLGGRGGSYGASGGSHTLLQTDLPNATLSLTGTAASDGAHTHTLSSAFGSGAGSANPGITGNTDNSITVDSAGAHTHSVTGTTASINGGVSQTEHLPKYVGVYIWERTV